MSTLDSCGLGVVDSGIISTAKSNKSNKFCGFAE
jgi:hypothetical protein